jgi:hypothetical protein
MDEAIREHDKLLLVLSRGSIESPLILPVSFCVGAFVQRGPFVL